MAEKYFTLDDALVLLGGLPSTAELQRLKKYYPKFQLDYRDKVLFGFFNGLSREQLFDIKVELKGLHEDIKNKNKKAVHMGWVTRKPKKIVQRLLYLRYRLDEGLSKREANGKLLREFFSKTAIDIGQSNIRKITHSKILDDME